MPVVDRLKDLTQELVSLGIPYETARIQVELLSRGPRYANLSRSAAIADGIVQLSEAEVNAAIDLYDSREERVKVLKFVPASGAATRMFQDLRRFLDSGDANPASKHFLENLTKIPFIERENLTKSHSQIADYLLSDEGLQLDRQPKGSILFHRYKDGSRTAFEEHLVEGASYAMTDREVHIHFTIAPEHLEQVKQKLLAWSITYGKLLSVAFDLQFSVQSDSTDTMCLDDEGEAIRHPDGRLMLRPGGHGSLIHNLNSLDADIIFIKNIDNVVPDNHRAEIIRYKKALGGLLIQVRRDARRHIEALKTGGNREDAIQFLVKMGIAVSERTDAEELIRLMNRPYRICGMVKNEGEPGGGPFWVKNGDTESLQIVESAQIDLSLEKNREMLDKGTHFNPVDLVCCLNDLYGQRQHLLDFVEMDAAYVTEKQVAGVKAQVLEWPGLWNGAMAHWNSLFVEVPISTFNPVKTVNDLLRPKHQAS
jgi:hypothetical protein